MTVLKFNLIVIACLGLVAVAVTAAFVLHPSISDAEKFSREESAAADQYHSLMRKDKALHIQIQEWAKARQSRCKARGQVLSFDSGGDPVCVVEQHAPDTTKPAENKH